MDANVQSKQGSKENQSQPKTGFEEIRDTLRCSFLKPVNLAGLSDSLFTLGDRQSWRFGFNALSLEEQRLYESLKMAHVYPIKDENPDELVAEGRLFVGLKKYGRSFIERYDDKQKDHSEYFGYINLDSEQQRILRQTEETSLLEGAESAAVAKSHLKSMTAEQFLEFATTVKHAVDHIDPILIYTNRSLFTNFGNFNNLLGKNSKPRKGMLLDDLLSGEPRELHSDEEEFLYCFYVLKQAGFRGEEFCGQQLNCSTLATYLDKKIVELSALAKVSSETSGLDLIAKAQLCKDLKQSVRSEYFVYRKINGLCFFKSEHYNLRSALDFSTKALPSLVTEYVQDTYGIKPENYEDVDTYFTEVVGLAAKRYYSEQDVGLNSVELLLKKVVQSAIEELNSEIGMTRGFRDLYKLYHSIRTGDEETVCGYPSTDYFCAVFMSPETREQLSQMPGMYSRVATAIAGRMTFNSWHYVPGHFAGGNTDGRRHYYVPPRMTDTAVWSDQHHPGHVLARVRYSIRSPSSLIIDGKKYYGLSDLRLMRRSGLPYSDGELMRSKEYGGYLRAIYQAMLDWSVEFDQELTVNAFDGKEWYSRQDA